MAEFASKGVAGAGLGTGIAGLALGVLNSSNNGNGLLGGLLGGGNQNVVSALQAENYSDKNAKEVYMQSLTDNRRLRDEPLLTSSLLPMNPRTTVLNSLSFRQNLSVAVRSRSCVSRLFLARSMNLL